MTCEFCGLTNEEQKASLEFCDVTNEEQLEFCDLINEKQKASLEVCDVTNEEQKASEEEKASAEQKDSLEFCDLTNEEQKDSFLLRNINIMDDEYGDESPGQLKREEYRRQLKRFRKLSRKIFYWKNCLYLNGESGDQRTNLLKCRQKPIEDVRSTLHRAEQTARQLARHLDFMISTAHVDSDSKKKYQAHLIVWLESRAIVYQDEKTFPNFFNNLKREMAQLNNPALNCFFDNLLKELIDPMALMILRFQKKEIVGCGFCNCESRDYPIEPIEQEFLDSECFKVAGEAERFLIFCFRKTFYEELGYSCGRIGG